MANSVLNVTVPKELNDVLAALLALVTAIKAGTPAAALVATELPALIGLLGELSDLPTDLSTEPGPSVDCGLLYARQIVWAILGKKS